MIYLVYYQNFILNIYRIFRAWLNHSKFKSNIKIYIYLFEHELTRRFDSANVCRKYFIGWN